MDLAEAVRQVRVVFGEVGVRGIAAEDISKRTKIEIHFVTHAMGELRKMGVIVPVEFPGPVWRLKQRPTEARTDDADEIAGAAIQQINHWIGVAADHVRVSGITIRNLKTMVTDEKLLEVIDSFSDELGRKAADIESLTLADNFLALSFRDHLQAPFEEYPIGTVCMALQLDQPQGLVQVQFMDGRVAWLPIESLKANEGAD